MCCTRLAENTGRKKLPFLAPFTQLCRTVSLQLSLRHVPTIGKNLLNSDTSSTYPHNMLNFGLLTAEICWWVWGTPANFNGFRVLAALLHEQRAPPIFGRATITLGTGPHSSYAYILHIIITLPIICNAICTVTQNLGKPIPHQRCLYAHVTLLLWPPCIAHAVIVFLSCGFFYLLSIFSSLILSRRILDVYHTFNLH